MGSVLEGSNCAGCSFSQPRLTTIGAPPRLGFRLRLRSVRMGISASGSVDGDAASVVMGQRDHVVDVGIARQNLRLDALDRKVHRRGNALNRRRDAENVLRPDRAVVVDETLEGIALKRWQRKRYCSCKRKIVQRWRDGQAHSFSHVPSCPSRWLLRRIQSPNHNARSARRPRCRVAQPYAPRECSR